LRQIWRNYVDTLRKQGVAFDEDWLQHISPLGWEHINLTGDYIWILLANSK
jgi:hypothetical protein